MTVEIGTPGFGSGGKVTAKFPTEYSYFGRTMYLIPGILLILYGVSPDSLPGRLGKLIYDLYGWVLGKK